MAFLSKASQEVTAMSLSLLMQAAAPQITWVGVVIPGAIFIVAFAVTWLLYKHFTKQMEDR